MVPITVVVVFSEPATTSFEVESSGDTACDVREGADAVASARVSVVDEPAAPRVQPVTEAPAVDRQEVRAEAREPAADPAVAPWPTATSATTDATPMTTPSIVRQCGACRFQARRDGEMDQIAEAHAATRPSRMWTWRVGHGRDFRVVGDRG